RDQHQVAMIGGEKLREFTSDSARRAGNESGFDGHGSIVMGREATNEEIPTLRKCEGWVNRAIGILCAGHGGFGVDGVPRGGGLQAIIDVVNVLDAFSLQPLAESLGALLCINRNAFLPGSSAAQHAVELNTGFGGEFERFGKFSIADARRQINERLTGYGGGLAEQVHGFVLAIRLLPRVTLRAFDELHVDRYFNFENINAVAVFAELLHALHYDLRLLSGVVQSLLIGAFFVSNELEKEWDVVGAAFVANAFYPGMLLLIHILRIEGRVVEENFDAISASFFQATGGPKIEQVGQTSRAGFVVSGLFIRQ